MNKGSQRTDLNKYLGGKRKKLKGGAQEISPPPPSPPPPPVNVYEMVDELIELGKKGNMSKTGGPKILEDKYDEIMKNIHKKTNTTHLKKVFVEIHHIMFQPNSRTGITPIDFYHESLRTKLQAIKNKICDNNFIEWKTLESDPNSIHFGGKRKTNKSKKPKRKTRKTHRK